MTERRLGRCRVAVCNPPFQCELQHPDTTNRRPELEHRAALAYSGEPYLAMGDLPRAEQRLAALDRICLLPCEEYTDLKKAVASYKAEGKK
jgi:hypothetical protein